MRIAGRAGPAALELAARIAAIHHAQSGDEFVGEELPPPPFISQAGERVQKIEIASDGAIAGLMPEDGEHDRGRHAVAAADIGEAREIVRIDLLAATDQSGVDVAAAIGLERRDRRIAGRTARLRLIELDRARAELEVGEDGVDRALADPLALGLGAQLRHERAKARFRIGAALHGGRRGAGIRREGRERQRHHLFKQTHTSPS